MSTVLCSMKVKPNMCYKPKSFANLRIGLPDIFFNGKSISVVNEHKYLGILLQDNQSDESDMKRRVKAIYTRVGTIGNMFSLSYHD